MRLNTYSGLLIKLRSDLNTVTLSDVTKRQKTKFKVRSVYFLIFPCHSYSGCGVILGMTFFLSILLVETLCVIGVIADYYLKVAGEGPSFINTRAFTIGLFLQASTAFGWFFVLKYLKLHQVGVYFSVSIVVMLTLIGVFQFNETLTRLEAAGIILAVISLLLLGRFA